MSHYFEYRTSSEAFLGEPINQNIPSVAICFNHNISNEKTFLEINFLTPNFSDIFSVSFAQKYKSNDSITGFKTNQKCFTVWKPLEIEDTSENIILSIISKKKILMDASFSFFQNIPRNYPQIQIENYY